MEDRVRLEVAIVDGKEMFSWPGDASFEEAAVLQAVRGGLFNVGNFGIYPRMVFFGEATVFTLRGSANLDRREVVRHDYVVPEEASGYNLQNGETSVRVGFHGSIFTDPVSFELVRLTAIAGDIPREVDIQAAEDRVDYGRVSFGGQSFLLPVASMTQIVNRSGVYRNSVTFARCARFGGESRLIVEDEDEGQESSSAVQRVVDLPRGTDVVVVVNDIDLESAAIGDRVRATVVSDVRQGKQVLIPKGAIASGRIVKLDRYAKQYLVEVRFQGLEWTDGSARLNVQVKSSKAGKADLDRSGNLTVSRATPKLTGLQLTLKVLP